MSDPDRTPEQDPTNVAPLAEATGGEIGPEKSGGSREIDGSRDDDGNVGRPGMTAENKGESGLQAGRSAGKIISTESREGGDTEEYKRTYDNGIANQEISLMDATAQKSDPALPKIQFPRLSPADQSEFDVEFDTRGLQRVRYYPPGRSLPAIGPNDEIHRLTGGGYLVLSEAGVP